MKRHASSSSDENPKLAKSTKSDKAKHGGQAKSSEAKSGQEEKRKAEKLLEKEQKNKVAQIMATRVQSYVPPKKYSVADPGELKAGIEEIRQGRAPVVFTLGLDEKQITELVGLFWDWAESSSPHVRRDDSKTWSNSNWFSILSVGILKYNGIGNSSFLWACRTLAGIRKLYETYYNRTDLLTSMDGCGVQRGAEHRVNTNTTWLHYDVNLQHKDHKDPFASIQGALNLVPVENATDHGSFLFIENSVGVYRARSADGQESKLLGGQNRNKQYLPFPIDHYWYKEIEAGRAQLKALSGLAAGDFFVWPSSMAHSGMSPMTSRIQGRLRRLVAYVTLQPNLLPVGDRLEFERARRNAAAKGYTTSHWPTETKDNRMLYPRSKTFSPVYTPASCFKTNFSKEELRLLLGIG